MNALRLAWNGFSLLVREVCEWQDRPLPVPAMLRSGCSIGACYLLFRFIGEAEGAVLSALFTNLLCLGDRSQGLRSRLWVTGICSLLSICAGAVGTLISGNDPLILVTLFAFALFAGFIHGTLPGVEAIPRYAIICFIADAYLPVGGVGALIALTTGTVIAMIVICIDHRIRHGLRSARVDRVTANVVYPGPSFSIAYGTASVFALGVGLIWAQVRPYWITITTLVVMQPDRRANMVRVVQRLLGTLGGVVGAFVVVRMVPTEDLPVVLVPLILILPFTWPYGLDRNYGLGVALMSLWVLLLIDSALPAAEFGVPLFIARLADTAIGCAVALAGSLFVLETRET